MILHTVTSKAQQINTYVLDFSDPTTYQVTCGSVNSAQWTVNSGTCNLYTPMLSLADTGEITINYVIRINQKGNMSADDKLHFQVKKSSDQWYTDTILLGNVSSNVRTVTGSLTLEHDDFVVFRFIAEINSSNGFWAIKNGDIEVDNVRLGDFLPVSLTGFSGYCQTDIAHLEWVTASETNNDYYTIERSDDGNTFYTAGYVQGAGNSNTTLRYSFTDHEPLFSQATFYRLRQTDYDGSQEVTTPIVIKKESGESANIWTYVENSSIFLNYETQIEESIQLMVFDMTGKLVENKALHAGKGFNMFEITLSGKSQGIWHIRITDSLLNTHSLKVLL